MAALVRWCSVAIAFSCARRQHASTSVAQYCVEFSEPYRYSRTGFSKGTTLTHALLLGGGESAKWVKKELSVREPTLPIIGMEGERYWLEGEPNVVGFVNPADLRSVVRTLNKNQIDSISVFGTPFSKLSWIDFTYSTTVILKALTQAAATGRPDLALPNTLFSTLVNYLRSNSIEVLSLRDFLPGLGFRPGNKIGTASIPDHEVVYSDSEIIWTKARRQWKKHGVLHLSNGRTIRQVSGTKSMLTAAFDCGVDLNGAILTIAEVGEFLNLDTPVIDEALVSLCIKYKLAGIVADARAIVINSDRIESMIQDSGFVVHFV